MVTHCGCSDNASAKAANKVADNADAESARGVVRVHHPELCQCGRYGCRQARASIDYFQVEIRRSRMAGATANPRLEADFTTRG